MAYDFFWPEESPKSQAGLCGISVEASGAPQLPLLSLAQGRWDARGERRRRSLDGAVPKNLCPRLKGAVAISILKESVGNRYSSRTMLFPDSQAWELAAFTYAPVGGLSRLCR